MVRWSGGGGDGLGHRGGVLLHLDSLVRLVDLIGGRVVSTHGPDP
jgi:hypothetical protein